MKSILIILILSGLFVLNASVYSQNPQWIVYDWPDSMLYGRCLTIDSNDIKWIPSDCELLRFDNQNWQLLNYFSAGLDTFNLPQTVTIDKDNNKWIGFDRIMMFNNSGGLYQFDNNGNGTAYYISNSGLPHSDIYDIAIDDSSNKWIATGGGLAKFNGTTWKVYNTDNSKIPSDRLLSIAIDNSGNKWIGTRNKGLVKFDNTNWQVFNTYNPSLPGNNIRSIAIDKNQSDIWISVSNSDWPYPLLAIAKFNGDNWTIYNSEVSVEYISCMKVDENSVIWLGSSNGLVKFDSGNWTVFTRDNSGLPNDGIGDMAIDGKNNKWIISDGLVVFNENGVVSIGEKNEDFEKFPNNFNINQNYPNPFNPLTNIEFDLPKSSDVRIEVYNTAGQKIQTLLNRKMSAGSHQVEFNAQDLSSGVYFYRIEAGEFQDVKKMILLR
jgi:ligand-binding sensor domain-containing protein